MQSSVRQARMPTPAATESPRWCEEEEEEEEKRRKDRVEYQWRFGVRGSWVRGGGRGAG